MTDDPNKTKIPFGGKPYQAPADADKECKPPVRSRQFLSGPDIAFIPVQGGVNAVADIPVNLPFPCNAFFVSAVKTGTEASSIMFHLTKIFKNYAAAAITATGTEPWISMTTLPAAGPIYRTVIRFKEPILQFFLDIGAEGGANTQITIAAVRDDSFQLNGGLY